MIDTYKALIIEMVHRQTDEHFLKQIYTIMKCRAEKERSIRDSQTLREGS